MHSIIVGVHITFAVAALIAGPLAVRYPNGTPRHRWIGRLYIAAWSFFGTTGFYLGTKRPGLTPFEVLNLLGAGFVLAALYTIFRRGQIGRKWKRYHYRNMLISYAFVAVATINQLLSQAGVQYPMWVFFMLAFSPFLVIPRVVRRLDATYGFTDVSQGSDPRAV